MCICAYYSLYIEESPEYPTYLVPISVPVPIQFAIHLQERPDYGYLRQLLRDAFAKEGVLA